MGQKDLIVLAVLIIALGFLSVCFWKFRKWAPKLWADQVRNHLSGLTTERDRLLAESKLGPAFRLRQVKEDLQRKQRRRVMPEALAEYPGIGPATVDKLKLAGLKSLDDLIDFPFQTIPGFGPSRSADLRNAVRELMHKTRATFDDGSSPEGQDYLRAVGELADADRAAQLARDHRLSALEDAIDDTTPLLDVANRITLYLYLEHSFANKDVPGVSEGLLFRPMPVPADTAPTPSIPSPPPAEKLQPAAPAPAPSPANPQLAKFRAFVRFGFLAARADGKFARDEKKEIRRFLGDSFGSDPVLVRHIDPEMEAVEADPPEEAATLSDVSRVASDAEKQDLYTFAERVAEASGERNDREIAFLNRVRTALGVVEKAPAVVVAKPAAPSAANPVLSDPRAALDIDPGTELTVELIRRKYNLVFDRNDPAKAATLGPEYVKMTEAKRTAARAAAETLIAPFGVPLDPPAAPPPPADIRHNPDLDDVFGR